MLSRNFKINRVWTCWFLANLKVNLKGDWFRVSKQSVLTCHNRKHSSKIKRVFVSNLCVKEPTRERKFVDKEKRVLECREGLATQTCSRRGFLDPPDTEMSRAGSIQVSTHYTHYLYNICNCIELLSKKITQKWL